MMPIYSHMYAVGNTELLALTVIQEQGIVQHHENVLGFYRLLKDGIIYHCINYNQNNSSESLLPAHV